MSNEEEIDLKEIYPDYLKTEEFKLSHFRFLLPYVLEKGKMYKRSDVIRKLVSAHEKISGLKVNKTIENLGNGLKKGFCQKDNLKQAEHSNGHWIYIGESNSGKFNVNDEQIINVELSPIKKTTPFEILKTIDALSLGDETLYVWWHPESERLAKLEGRNEWAMKIGKHNSRNVENRIEDYKTPIPYKPIFGLVVFCKEPYDLEKCVHLTLEHRNKKIGEVGNEWFITSVSEIEEILEFNHLIAKS